MSELPPGTTELIERALDEDIGSGDVTAEATVPADLEASAKIVLKQPGVIFGLGVVEQVFRQAGATVFVRVAMDMLRSKLIELEERKRTEAVNQERGEVKDVAWCSQIRSYVLHPYTMVKDHRTEYEVGYAQRDLDGDIDGFIREYLNRTV